MINYKSGSSMIKFIRSSAFIFALTATAAHTQTLVHVANNSALMATATTSYSAVVRDTFSAASKAPPIQYLASSSACPLNAGNGDSGSQVKSSDGKCWIAAFPSGGLDVREFGALCDGSTDDTSAIKNTIAAAGTGGAVQFPKGKCYLSGNSSIQLNDIALIGTEVAYFSESNKNNFEGGTILTVGTQSIAPGAAVPFFIGHSVTIRGLSIIYPYTIFNATSPQTNEPPLFSDNGQNGGGSGNVLIENVHVVAPNIFWQQSGTAPTYGNIRFNNVDVYAVSQVFVLSNIQEVWAMNNFLSNPSLCSAGGFACNPQLTAWTGNNAIWLHVVGSPAHAAVGMAATNVTVSYYRTGILIDSDGQMDEAVFGPTSVWDGVPTVLYVNSNGSITHTVFSGKYQNSRPIGAPAFWLQNPQLPIGTGNQDNNTISFNGFTADGPAYQFLYIDATSPSANLGSINLTGVVVRDYCTQLQNIPAVQVMAPGKGSVMVVGSQFTYRNHGATPWSCGTTQSDVININAANSLVANNVYGKVPTQ